MTEHIEADGAPYSAMPASWAARESCRSSARHYYNETRTHLSLDKDAPVARAIQTIGRIFDRPVLEGLHHQYLRT
jgi:hypothetical protein